MCSECMYFVHRHHMRSMRQMNSIMNSLMPDPFGMMSPFDGFAGAGARHSALTGAAHHRAPMGNSLMPFGFQSMPNINSLLNGGRWHIASKDAHFGSSPSVRFRDFPTQQQFYEYTSNYMIAVIVNLKFGRWFCFGICGIEN